MKKFISLILAFQLMLLCLFGCGINQSDGSNKSKGEPIKVVATIFPIYDWVRQITGENAQSTDLKLLIKNGVDLHSYQMSAEDMVSISEADVFIYVGGHSDEWVEAALKNSENPDRVVINLFELLSETLKPLKMTEGMEDKHMHEHDEHEHKHDEHEHDEHEHDEHEHDEHEHDEHEHDEHEHDEHKHDEHEHDEHEHDEHEHDEHHHEHEYNDEHIWLSLKRSKTAVNAIAEQLAKKDEANADIYISNAKKYIEELDKLDKEYESAAALGKKNTVLFADRFPFFYLADDYNLGYYAAFTGCSGESEASFETAAILAQKIDELSLENVLTIENRSHKIAETVIESTRNKNQNVLVMNSMQSVTQKQLDEGMTYLDVMKANLDVLKAALE